jgi:hypothetical protein
VDGQQKPSSVPDRERELRSLRRRLRVRREKLQQDRTALLRTLTRL